jgi:hypothetical protein
MLAPTYLSFAPLLPHNLRKGGGLSLDLVAQVTLVAIAPFFECSKSLTKIVTTASSHWKDIYTSTTFTSTPDVVLNSPRKGLLIVGHNHVEGGAALAAGINKGGHYF